MENSDESTWTFYFEEFLRKNDREHNFRSFSSGYGTQSLVSDAASSAAVKKVTSNDNYDQVVGSAWGTSCKRLSFKKRKTKGVVIIDDDLEDTASSPANSPKVSYFDQPKMKKKDKEILDISKKKVGNCGLKDELDVVDHERDSHYSELKKRGLCLVPLSSLANYLA